jgi:hypothetical protein
MHLAGVLGIPDLQNTVSPAFLKVEANGPHLAILAFRAWPEVYESLSFSCPFFPYQGNIRQFGPPVDFEYISVESLLTINSYLCGSSANNGNYQRSSRRGQ